MEDNIRLFSSMDHFEIININDGDKHGYLCDNDIVIDEKGEFKCLILNEPKNRFSFFSNNTFSEVPWEYIKKIGSKTIIIDIDDRLMKKTGV
ncbi:YlmC/YmxH family sporulation protein [Haloimpatiens massiliensis]|uniref:YlmC/YmxH family sporulation protein n=1 Tax=Haloimpatiens massiliensis TaxID=1658110 RepID=UPI000C85637F|nr:YlmC/YmxH family sporulation protein [Haloimpatiens massiliensis]